MSHEGFPIVVMDASDACTRTLSISADATAPVIARLSQSSIDEQFTELVGERSNSPLLRVKNFECAWGHWTAWIVPGFECAQVFAQRYGNRDQETLASLADGERDLLASQIDLCPGQCG